MIPPLPQLAQGYARSRGQSAYPWAWDGLVCHFAPRLGPQGIATLPDFSGRGRSWTMLGAVTGADWVAQRRGWALSFDTAGDSYQLSGAIPVTAFPFSLACWFYWDGTDVTNTSVLVGLAVSGATNVLYQLKTGTGVVAIVGRNTTTRQTNSAAIAAGWHHVVGLFVSSTDRRLYVDGVRNEASVNNSSATFNASTDDLFVRRSRDSDTVDTDLDILISEASVYNRLLLESEIRMLANGATPLALRRVTVGSVPASGPQTLATDSAIVTWTAQDATLVPGAVSITTTPAVVTWTAEDATLVPGAITLATTSAVVNWTAADAALVPGGTTIATTSAVVAWTAEDAGIEFGTFLSTTPAIVTWTAGDATLVPGAITISTTPAIVTWRADDATVPGAGQILPAESAVLTWHAGTASVLLELCPALLGCLDPMFTYSIENPSPSIVGTDCNALEGCGEEFFTYSIER